MNNGGCISSKREYFYILEIFVDRVCLYADKFEKLDPSSLGIDINFIDFPLIRIFQADFLYTKLEKMKDASRDAKYRVIHVDAGKIHLFPYNPAVLIKKMRETPVSLDVYKVKEIIPCPEGIRKESLGATQFPLAGCLCDQMMMAGNDHRHLPRSYLIKNTFNLVSKDDRPTGVIALSVKLTCFGDFIGSRFAYVDKTLIFKNVSVASVKSYDNEERKDDTITLDEFHCMKVPLFDEEDRKADERERKICMPHVEFDLSELDLPPRSQHVAGLVSICNELLLNDGFPRTMPNALKEPKESFGRLPPEPQIDPACGCSTNDARFKFNDGDKPPSDVACAGGLCIGSKLLYTLPKNYQYDGDKLQSCSRNCTKCSQNTEL